MNATEKLTLIKMDITRALNTGINCEHAHRVSRKPSAPSAANLTPPFLIAKNAQKFFCARSRINTNMPVVA
jgi:hypothetical protein